VGLTKLTPLAALGLSLTMVGALVTHLKRQGYPMAASNLVLMALALFVAFGRFFVLPFYPEGSAFGRFVVLPL
jgi:hypothetical protein